MRIGIDGLVLRGRDAGTLRYIEQLLTALACFGSVNDYVFFANEHILSLPELPRKTNFIYQKTRTPRFLPAAISQQLYPAWQSSGKLDILHTAGFVPPISYSGKTVMTVFDLTYWVHPETQMWTGRTWWRLFGAPGMQKANRLIAISENTKKEVCRLLHISSAKVKVVYPYLPSIFVPVPSDSASAQEVIKRYHLPEKYILYVGTLERRKNIPTLLRAYAAARRNGSIQHALVLVGQKGWLYQDIFDTIKELGIERQVIFAGYVPDKDLPALYSSADLFVYLSLYEGFGLPVLEAMACGVPVLTSNAASLPEVVGDAGVLVSPNDIDQAGFEIERILSDRELHATNAARGLEQARQFSIENFAQQTLAIYEDLKL